MAAVTRILGIDPGLVRTGWGVIDVSGVRLDYVASGECASGRGTLAQRLAVLHNGLHAVIEGYRPDEAAIEESFVSRNARTTLLLGHARGVALLAPGLAGVPIAEYAPNAIKRTVVGPGLAEKRQVEFMVEALLRGATFEGAHAADALAVAICRSSQARGATRALEERIVRRAVRVGDPV